MRIVNAAPLPARIQKDVAFMLLYYAVDRGQAQAGAFALRFRGEERLENVLPSGDAGPCRSLMRRIRRLSSLGGVFNAGG